MVLFLVYNRVPMVIHTTLKKHPSGCANAVSFFCSLASVVRFVFLVLWMFFFDILNWNCFETCLEIWNFCKTRKEMINHELHERTCFKCHFLIVLKSAGFKIIDPDCRWRIGANPTQSFRPVE